MQCPFPWHTLKCSKSPPGGFCTLCLLQQHAGSCLILGAQVGALIRELQAGKVELGLGLCVPAELPVFHQEC